MVWAGGEGSDSMGAAKGKGKVNPKVAEDSATKRENNNSSASLASMVVETNSIHSRLRSSRTLSTGSIPDLFLPLPSLSSSAATRRKRPRKPKIEGKYEYQCPVSGCRHIHGNGRWRPERDDIARNLVVEGLSSFLMIWVLILMVVLM